MKNRALIALVVVALVGLSVLLFLRRSPGSKELAPTGRIKPRLLMTFDGGAVPQESLLPLDAKVDLRVSLASPAFVYLYDDFQNSPELMSEHAGDTPWEPGEYAADTPELGAPGLHRLVLIATPRPLPEPKKWRIVAPAGLEAHCPDCEWTTLSLYVVAPDAG